MIERGKQERQTGCEDRSGDQSAVTGGFEGGGRNAGYFQKLGKARKWILLPLRRKAVLWNIDFSPVILILDI